MPILRPDPTPSPSPAARLRLVRPSDWEALNALHRWAWFPQRSQAGWTWMFSLSAALPGWVLEDDEGVCGFLGNLVQDYVWDGQRRKAATGYSLIVLPRARGGSRLLLKAFREQPDVFAVSILNGNRRSADVYAGAGLDPFPPGWANAKIVWPINLFTIGLERLIWSLRCVRRPRLELFRGAVSAPALRFRDARVRRLDPIADAAALDRYQDSLHADGRLRADRSAATLAQRLQDPDQTTAPILLGVFPGGEDDGLQAVALAQLGKMSELEAPILDIIDLTWRPGASLEGPRALMEALKTAATDFKASRLRLPLVNAELAEAALGVKGALLRRRHTHAHARLVNAEVAAGWTPTPYDGDYGFALRPTPRAEGPGDNHPSPANMSHQLHIA